MRWGDDYDRTLLDMSVDIREAPEKVQVLYDAFTEAFGEPVIDDPRMPSPAFVWARHTGWSVDHPMITRTPSGFWFVWSFDDAPHWLQEDQFEIEEIVAYWVEYLSKRGWERRRARDRRRIS